MKMKIFGIFAAIAILIPLLFFYLFDQFVTSVGRETVKTWIRGEETAIAEGNLLSSVTKTQRILLSSEFVKGIVAYDISHSPPRSLIEFGEKPSLYIGQLTEQMQIHGNGFLRKQIFVSVPQAADIRIGFSVHSDRVETIFWITNLVFFSLFAAMGVTLLFLKRKEEERVRSFANQAGQASHDLTQPLFVLNSLASRFDNSTETLKTLKFVIGRITEIVEDLAPIKSKNRVQTIRNSHTTIEDQLRNLIAEKSVRAGHEIQISISVRGSLKIFEDSESDFLRVIANLVDNSIDAMTSSGRITVEIFEDQNELNVIIADDGKGIPAELIPRLGEQGLSFDKEFGTGLGLFGAKNYVRSLGGHVVIRSNLGRGTQVALKFPLKTQDKVLLTSDTELIILDDDLLCHQAWKTHFQNLEIENQISYFSKVDEFQEYLQTTDADQVFVFSDFDLQDSRDGVDVLSSNDLVNQGVLVTGRPRDPKVQEKAAASKVAVYDKGDLSKIPIEFI